METKREGFHLEEELPGVNMLAVFGLDLKNVCYVLTAFLHILSTSSGSMLYGILKLEADVYAVVRHYNCVSTCLLMYISTLYLPETHTAGC